MDAIADPGYQKVLERLDQENYWLSSEDYARQVEIWYDEEKANVERVGLSLKPYCALRECSVCRAHGAAG